MASYRPLRVCKCGKCSSDLGTVQEKEREEDKVNQLLYGLDDAYFCTVRSSLVSRTTLQPMEEVYKIVRQEEDLRTVQKLEEEASMTAVTAFDAQAKGHGRGDDSNKSNFCKNCNRSGTQQRVVLR